MKFIDLFCGIGGFAQAIHGKHADCVFACDSDPDACHAYTQNIGIEPHGDINAIDPAHIPPHDIMCAGFPCQSFSQAGNRKGTGDHRGKLFRRAIAIAKVHRPNIIMFENVPGIATVQEGAVLNEIIKSLNGMGYFVEWNVLNAAQYELPQARKRLYIVALHEKSRMNYYYPLPTNRLYPLIKVMQTLPSAIIEDPKCLVPVMNNLKTENCRRVNWTKRIGNVNNAHWGRAIYDPILGTAKTQLAGNDKYHNSGLYVQRIPPSIYHREEWKHLVPRVNKSLMFGSRVVRRLTLTEQKAVMGFPKTWHANNKQLGNAVIPKMVELIYQRIKEGRKWKLALMNDS